jgi:hypothetical protein
MRQYHSANQSGSRHRKGSTTNACNGAYYTRFFSDRLVVWTALSAVLFFVSTGLSAVSADEGKRLMEYFPYIHNNKIVVGPSVISLVNSLPGLVISGFAEKEAVGSLVCSLGDISDDGFGEIIVQSGVNTTGELYLIFGDDVASNINVGDILSGAGSSRGVIILGPAFYFDHVGWFSVSSCGSAGDFNNDGLADIVIGSTDYENNRALIYVIYGNTTFPDIINTEELEEWQGFNVTYNLASLAVTKGINVGGKVDLNEDGYSDIIAGIPGTGEAVIIFGNSSTTSITLNTSSTVPSNMFRITGGNDYFGSSVSGLQHFRGADTADIVIGCYGCDNFAGRAYVLYGAFLSPGGSLNIQKLKTSKGFYIRGAAETFSSGDGAGMAVSSAGDMNGDGLTDLVVAAGWARSTTGIVYVIYGSSVKFKNVQLSLLAWTQGFGIYGSNAGDTFGLAAAGAGDVNADGYDDIVIGCPNGFVGAGAAYIIYGSGTLGTIHVASMTSSQGFAIIGPNSFSNTGQTVSGGYDINRDGYSDVVVGAPYAETGNVTGAAYIVYGGPTRSADLDLSAITYINTLYVNEQSPMSVAFVGNVGGGATHVSLLVGSSSADNYRGRTYLLLGSQYAFRYLNDLTSLKSFEGIIVTGAADGDESGYSVSTAGDVNSDGYDDFVIGAPGLGAAYVIFGGDLLSDIDLASFGSSLGFVISGSADSLLGVAVSNAGDVDGDGYDDIIVGAPSLSGSSSAAAAYIVFGGVSLSSISVTDAVSSRIVKVYGGLGRIGVSVGNAGDVNGDGYSDIIVGVPNDDDEVGHAVILFGKASMTDINVTVLSAEEGIILTGVDHSFGTSVSGANDVNGDGYADVIIGSPNDNLNTGACYIIFGSASVTDMTVDTIAKGSKGYAITGASDGDGFGTWVERADDVNGDGFPDVIVGAPGVNLDSGAAYVIYGHDTFEDVDVTSAECQMYTGGTLFQHLGSSVAAVTDSTGNVQLAIGSSATYDSFDFLPAANGAIYIVTPTDAASDTSLAPTPLPTPAPSPVPSARPTSVPTPTPTVPTPSPTTLWHHEGPTILGFIIPVATVTLPLCFSRQICEVLMDKYGVSNSNAEGTDELIAIRRAGTHHISEPVPIYIEIFRMPCDVLYGADYKASKLTEFDFGEKVPLRPVSSETASEVRLKAFIDDCEIGHYEIGIAPHELDSESVYSLIVHSIIYDNPLLNMPRLDTSIRNAFAKDGISGVGNLLSLSWNRKDTERRSLSQGLMQHTSYTEYTAGCLCMLGILVRIFSSTREMAEILPLSPILVIVALLTAPGYMRTLRIHGYLKKVTATGVASFLRGIVCAQFAFWQPTVCITVKRQLLYMLFSEVVNIGMVMYRGDWIARYVSAAVLIATLSYFLSCYYCKGLLK